ncbi:hypothetical protein EON64_02270 [archaeon]|nr:MAG: hypothetical protein EON64_02270 [archaeon]
MRHSELNNEEVNVNRLVPCRSAPDTPFANSGDNFQREVILSSSLQSAHTNHNVATSANFTSSQRGESLDPSSSTDWILESDGDFFVPPKNLFGCEENQNGSNSHIHRREASSNGSTDEFFGHKIDDMTSLVESSAQAGSLADSMHMLDALATTHSLEDPNDPLYLASLPSTVWQYTTTCNLPYPENIHLSAQGCVLYVMQGCLRLRNNLSLFAAASLACRVLRPIVVLVS